MPDIQVRWNTETMKGDIEFAANDVVMDDGLGTAVLISLFTDARARADDALPDPHNTDKRGCWMDGTSERAGDSIGSRLWLLNRSKIVPETLRLAEEYAREALQWLLDERVAVRIDVTATSEPNDMLGLEVKVYRAYKDAETFEYQISWEGTANYAT